MKMTKQSLHFLIMKKIGVPSVLSQRSLHISCSISNIVELITAYNKDYLPTYLPVIYCPESTWAGRALHSWGWGGGGVRTFQKFSHLSEGVQNFLLEKGDKPEKGGGNVEMGVGTSFTILQLSSITFTMCVDKVRFPLLLFGFSIFWVSHARFSSTFSAKSFVKTQYHLYISDPFR